MKKGIGVFIALILLVFMFAFVSAGITDWITGRAVDLKNADYSISWEDSDEGNNPYEGGVIYNGDLSNLDSCISSTRLEELYLDSERIRECQKRNWYGACRRWANVERQVILTEEIDCINGCESVSIDYKGVSLQVGQCEPADCSDSDVSDAKPGGRDPYAAGVVTISGLSGASQYQADERVIESGQTKIKEYFCRNGLVDSKTFECAGAVKSEDIAVTSEITKTAYYCEVSELTCSKEGKTVTYSDAAGQSQSQSDQCISASQRRVYGCTEENTIDEGTIEACENGCRDGECLLTTCTETDDGQDIVSKGTTTSGDYVGTDLCLSKDKVLEFFCSSPTSSRISVIPRSCPSGQDCLNGACMPQTENGCYDSDEGKKYRIKGSVTDASGTHEDKCGPGMDAPIIEEWYCDNQGNAKFDTKLCDCVDGACVDDVVRTKTLTSASPISDFIIRQESYTIELVSASDTEARLKISDSQGENEAKSISEGSSKSILGFDVKVISADEDTATNTLSVEVEITG